MDSKKFSLPVADHVITPRKKVISGFILWISASLILLSVILFTNSLKGRVVSPLLQGFNAVHTLNSSWPFSFPTSSFTNTSGNEVLLDNPQMEKDGNFVDFSSGSVNGSVFNSTHLGNFSDFGNNGSLHGEDLSFVGNFSVTIDGDLNANVSVGEENSIDVNNAVVGGDDKEVDGSDGEENGGKSLEKCDIFDGGWVRDETKPYYPAGSCPHVDRDFNCHPNGRPDDGFLKWKWQPNGCNIPSLNATDFLERLRGQTLVFVGDSLNRNMWESLVCILRNSIENKERVYEISGRTEFKKKGFYAFRFEDYNCSVDFVGSPFLVRESSFNSKNGTLETLRLDLMDQTTKMYEDADIIVFNTGHWWTHEKTSKGEDYYQEGNYVHPRLKVLEAYKRALLTWAKWVDNNVDSNRTQVFFRGYSVTHFRGGQWNSGGQCHKETEPIFNTTYFRKYPSKMRAFEHVLQEMKSPVMYLNISRLTDYRKDGHPSIYRMQYKTEEERIAAERSQDCSHWCLPGVPDTWNELLYASLLKAGRGSWKI
ncbi:protein trichome birefringence-like 2 [Mercurialis annua]|uniref:protein trichome birefringence-like 2 n=1 Tax=Mercurialis annua TaxID=3986 RepID=UPI00215FD3D4|nr:protein trichome birefringence-like 2 [Mercurialis annua]